MLYVTVLLRLISQFTSMCVLGGKLGRLVAVCNLLSFYSCRSVATILSHNYFRNRKKLPKKVAGLLLSAILSDTLNLNSPTCTDIDKLMVATLSKIAGKSLSH